MRVHLWNKAQVLRYFGGTFVYSFLCHLNVISDRTFFGSGLGVFISA